MKISTLLIFFMVIAAVFFTFNLGVDEMNTQYNSNINSSEWNSQYDLSDSVNSSLSSLQNDLKQIQDEDNGWFTKLGAGIVAIPHAVVTAALTTLGLLPMMATVILGFFKALGIPQKLIALALLISTIYIIYRLIAFYGKTEL